MDIQNIDLRRGDFEAMHPKAKLFGFDEDKKLYTGDGVESINDQWTTWCACIGMLFLDGKEAQAVPEWIDYSKQSPRIDGPYQIFIMNQQLVAEWESPWGFSSIEDGDALNQELITHWSVLGSDPVIEAQEPAND